MAFHNLAREYSTTTGTSDAVLTGAVPGFNTWELAGVTNGETVRYGITTYDTASHRPTHSEVGTGTYNTGTNTLARTTVISSTNAGSKITLTGLSEVFITFLAEDTLRVREVDSAPNVTGVNTIVVTNGTLTDNGSGSVTLTTGGGGGGALPSFAIYENSVVPANTSIANSATVDPATLDTEVVDDTGLFTLAANVLTCPGGGTFDVQVSVYFIDASNFGNGALWAYMDSDSVEAGPVNWPQLVVHTAADSAKTELQYTFGGPITLGAGDTMWFGIINESGGTISAGITTVRIIELG
jgi:hypothetical protein